MKNIYLNPAFYAHIINVSLLLFALIIFYTQFSKIRKLEPYRLIMLSLLFASAIGVHGLSHQGLENSYGYNPLSQLFN